jgi:hypothetical protein
VEGYLHAFFPSALAGGEWSASRPGLFTLRERAPGIHLTGMWEGPRAGLDAAVAKRNINSPCQVSNPCRRARRSITILSELPRLIIFLLTFPNPYLNETVNASLLFCSPVPPC